MKNGWQVLVVAAIVGFPIWGAAAEPEVEILHASWAMDAPVTGDHAVALIAKVVAQVDQTDFAPGEWRRYKIGLSDVTVTLTLLHRYDGSPTDFPTPAAGAEEWSLQLSNSAYGATIEWTTAPASRRQVRQVFTRDDRQRMLPRSASDPRVAMDAALQHARLDALHPGAALIGILRGGYPVWQSSTGPVFELGDHGQSRLPRLLIIASGYNVHRSTLGRDATMGPACVGWQVCGEQRGVAAQN